MTKEERQNYILEQLEENDKAISANEFAKILEVSRQVIVGDVALLRASGHEVIATGKGYILAKYKNIATLALMHTPKETRQELELFVKHNIWVIDVIVTHPIYGELKGQVNVKNEEDINRFLLDEPQLLSILTDGIHLHTVSYEDLNDLNEVKKDLDLLGFLLKA